MAQIISVGISRRDLKRFSSKARKIRKFIDNPLSLDVLTKVDDRLKSISQSRRKQIERSGNTTATQRKKRSNARRGITREIYKGGRRPTRASNVNKYGRDTGALFTDLFNPRLKPGNENSIIAKRIKVIKRSFSSYSWVYKEENQPNKIAKGMRERIQKKLGYFLFNNSDRENVKTLLLRLLRAKLS